jgi:hypothetical protein
MYRGQYPPDPPEDAQQPKPQWQQRLHEAVARTEDELRDVIQYVNDAVVPDVRRHGSEALRIAAEELRKLAQRLDDQRAARGGSQSGSTQTDPAGQSGTTGEPKL